MIIPLDRHITPAYGWEDNTKVILAEDVKQSLNALLNDLKLDLENQEDYTGYSMVKEKFKQYLGSSIVNCDKIIKLNSNTGDKWYWAKCGTTNPWTDKIEYCDECKKVLGGKE